MRPNKITFCDSLIFILFILSGKGNLVALPRIINRNFPGFGFIQLILNQFNKFLVSCCKSSKTSSKSLSRLCIVLSWAKLHMFVLSTKTKFKLINNLNNNEPQIDPCGRALIMSYKSLPEKFTFVCCFPFDKYLGKRFNPDLPMPQASNFANIYLFIYLFKVDKKHTIKYLLQ